MGPSTTPSSSAAAPVIRTAPPTADPCGPAPRREDLAQLSNAELTARFAIGVEHFDRRVLEIGDDLLDTSFLPDAGVGRWSIRTLLGHLADAEMHFIQRIRRVIVEDNPILYVWDEDAFIESGIYGGEGASRSLKSGKLPVAGSIGTIHTLRRWTTDLLRALPEASFARRALHPERGEQTLRIIAEYDVWHLEHHAWYLNKKVHKLLGPAVEKAATGCGMANCTCKGGRA